MKHVLEFEIRFYLRVIQVVFSLAHLLGVELPIGWAKREAALLCVDQLLHARGFIASFRGGSGNNARQQFLRRLWRLRHLIVEREGRVIRITQKLGPLRAQLRETRHDRFRIVLATMVATTHRSLEETL